ncbi:hypothetical protein OZN48_07225 [Chryseobacterium indologenes]|uniref:hypothetical protein n=1 Tax=Chryseobacterium indologenes TaxID=253 RepID=UPI002D7EA4E0|nr:hypothetical protein [Chryseobacterium indologenes]MEB4760274.1 hypothetical protein [Chryseobacterium indologenes]
MTLPDSMRETSYNFVKINDLLRGQKYSREDHFKLSAIQKIYLQKKEQSVFILYASCIQFTDIKGLDFEIYRVLQ